MQAVPTSDSHAPSIEPGVLRRLTRLDPDLAISWSSCLRDPATGARVEVSPTSDSVAAGQAIHDPHWYLWLRSPDGRVRLVAMYPHFGHAEVAALERDCMRQGVRPRDLLAIAVAAREALRAREGNAQWDLTRQKIRANRSRIRDLASGRLSLRQARTVSAPGVGRRGTPGLIRPDSIEDGWELPRPIEGGNLT